jgi:DNA-binding CsgD family transcriptional regulator
MTPRRRPGPRLSRGPAYTLTPREREVVTLLAQGQHVKDVSRRLGVSVRTAEKHRENAMATLGLHHRAALVAWAIVHGLVSVDELAAIYELGPYGFNAS